MQGISRWRCWAAAAALSPVTALLLTACGGSDSTAAAAATQTANASSVTLQSVDDDATAASPPFQLFVPDLAHSTIAAVSSRQPDAGTVLASLQLAPGATGGNNVQVDAARDELYAIAGHQVDVYAGASTLSAASVPARSFALPISMVQPHALFLDAADDILYVGGDASDGGEIAVYDFAHTVRGTTVTPTRVMFVDGGATFFTIDTTRARLYLVNAEAGVHVYAGADTASGLLSEVTTIPVLGTGLAVDASRDRLYVADPFAGLLLVDQASAASPVLTGTISIDDASYVSVDTAADRAYVTAGSDLYVLDGASTLTAATAVAAPVTSSIASSSFGAPAWR